MPKTAKILLNKTFSKLGVAGSVINVKKGYARNFLVRRGIGTFVTEDHLNNIDKIVNERKSKEESDISVHNKIKDYFSSLDEPVIVLNTIANEDGRLFGKISNKNVSSAMLEVIKKNIDKNIDFDRNEVSLSFEKVKSIGTFDLKCTFYTNVTFNTFFIVKSTEKKDQ